MSFFKVILGLTLGLALPLSAQAQGDPNQVIINYSYHNQIYGSVVTVHGDGLVIILEHTCCPAHTDSIHTIFKPEVIQNLTQAVELAKAGQIIMQPGLPTSASSLSGDFIANDSLGQPVIIEKIEANPTVGQPDRISLNMSPAAKGIQDLISALVTTKMPSLYYLSLPKQAVYPQQ